jgi:hypothetical protein
MIAHAQRIGHDRERWIHRAARRKEARINHVKIVELVGLAVAIKRRCLWVVSETDRAVLVRHRRKRQTLSQIKIPREQTLMTLVPVNVAIGLFHRFLQLYLQSIVTFDIIQFVTDTDLTVAID